MKQSIYLDANVLMELYEYPVDIANSILDIINEYLNDDIIIPERVLFEFLKNEHKRYNVNKTMANTLIANIKDSIKNIQKSLESLENNEILKSFGSEKLKSLMEPFKRTFLNSQSSIESYYKEIRNNYSDHFTKSNDPIKDFANMHYSKINTSLKTKIELVEYFKKRIELGIPPSITDQNKKFDINDPFNKYGDCLIWNEVCLNVRKAKSVVFITNETKNDFWENYNKRKINAFLCEEFYSYNPESTLKIMNFYEFYKKYIQQYIKEDDIDIDKFFLKKADFYNRIFENTEYIENVIQDFSGLDDYNELSKIEDTSVDGGNVVEYSDFIIEQCKIKPNSINNIRYNINNREIRVEIILLINGKCYCCVNKGHFDDEDINDNLYCNYKGKMECVLYFDCFEDKIAYKNREIKNIELDLDPIYDEFSENDEGQCSKCGVRLNFDNNAGNGLCIDCAKESNK